MAKLPRYLQKMFGSTAGLNQISKFGSFAAGSPIRYSGSTVTPDDIQALSNFLGGWKSAVVGNNASFIEDLNAVCYLYAYQLSYLFQAGIPEWNSTTTYYIGSVVSINSTGSFYRSIVDNNTGNAVSDSTKWAPLLGSITPTQINNTNSPITLAAGDNTKLFLVDTSAGTVEFDLPASPGAGYKFSIKDIAGDFNLNPVTLVPNGAQEIEGLNVSYTCQASFGVWNLEFDGTNWWLV